jgi:hypothetical protein
MSKGRWFGAMGAAGSDPLLTSLFRLLARTPERAAPVAAESAADAGWTASLRRGDDLPPCRLSILIASGVGSAVRLETFGRDAVVRRALDR